MSNILDLLKQILTSKYGKDVRQSIHDAIHKCYEDGKAGSIDLEAREKLDTVEAIAKGRSNSLAYETYEEMITDIKSMDTEAMKRGWNIYIGTVGVPDLWVYSVEEEYVDYTYVDDDTLVTELKDNVTAQIGYYKLGVLETQKVDLSEYSKTSHTHVATDISTTYHTLSSTEILPTGATATVESELVRFAAKILSIFDLITSIVTRITALENLSNHHGDLLVSYIELESGNITKTITGWDLTKFKGFVIGVECTGGDGTQYSKTRYIPRNYASISNVFKHVLTLDYGQQYSFIGFASLNISAQTVTFSTTAFSGWTKPRWFMFGVK